MKARYKIGEVKNVAKASSLSLPHASELFLALKLGKTEPMGRQPEV